MRSKIKGELYILLCGLFLISLISCQDSYPSGSMRVRSSEAVEEPAPPEEPFFLRDTLPLYKDRTLSEAFHIDSYVIEINSNFDLSVYMEGDTVDVNNTLTAITQLDVDSTNYATTISYVGLYDPEVLIPIKDQSYDIIIVVNDGKILEVSLEDRVFLSDTSFELRYVTPKNHRNSNESSEGSNYYYGN